MNKQFPNVYCPTGCKVVGLTVAIVLSAQFLSDVITKVRSAINDGDVSGVDSVRRSFTKKGDQLIKTSIEVAVSYNPSTGVSDERIVRITKDLIANALQTLAATNSNIRDAVQKADSSFIQNDEAALIASTAIFGVQQEAVTG